MEKVKVGVIGLGMMGNTHLDVYAKREDVDVVAVADACPERLSGQEMAQGNVDGQAQGGDDEAVRGIHRVIFPRTTGQRAPVALGRLLGLPCIVSLASTAKRSASFASG